MTLETYRKAKDLKDLGSLTVPCPNCKKETKLRDFDFDGERPQLCSKCTKERRIRERGEE